MSLISDALKKVQKEREKSNLPSTPPPAKRRKRNRPLLLLFILCGAVALALLFKHLIIKPLPRPTVQNQQSPLIVQQKRSIPKTADSKNLTTPESLIQPTSAEEQKIKEITSRQPQTETKNASSFQSVISEKGEKRVQPPDEKKSALNIRSEQPASKDRLTQLVNSGDRFFNERNYLFALESYRQALEISPDNRELYLKIYRVLRLVENWSLARAYLQEACKKWPTDYELGIGYLIVLLKNRDYQSVVELAGALLETFSRDSALFTYRGLGYFHLRQYPQAIENFQHSLQLSSSGFENYYYLGLIADNSGDFEQAANFYRRFLETANDEPKFSRHIRWAGERIKLIEKKLGGER